MNSPSIDYTRTEPSEWGVSTRDGPDDVHSTFDCCVVRGVQFGAVVVYWFLGQECASDGAATEEIRPPENRAVTLQSLDIWTIFLAVLGAAIFLGTRLYCPLRATACGSNSLRGIIPVRVSQEVTSPRSTSNERAISPAP